MASGQVYELAILLSLKDAASGKLDHVRDKLKATGKEGKATLQSFEELRKGLKRDLVIGGIGVAGLTIFKNGVLDAATFQSSLTDLRTSLTQLNADGSINLTQLGDHMNRAERLAVKLGNALPGSTEDFVQMLQAAKQAGLDTETILQGAGEAIANLAVANNQVPKDIATDVARFGKLYQLRPDEYIKATDLFSRIYTAKGIQSGELIEAAKYFQGRAGAALKLTGLEGAEQATRFLAFMRERGGLEGSEAGTASSTFLQQLVSNKKAIGEIKKEYGITLDLFDKKGQFKGLDNAFEQLQKFQKLNPKQQMEALNKLGGERGAMAGTAMVQGGLEGWRTFNTSLNTTISQQDKVTQKSKDFNNQLEALQGTLSNLKVTAFEPMLGPLTMVADKANVVVGAIQGFGAAHPYLTATATGIFGIGSAALVAYSGVRTLQTGWKLWRIVSAVGSNEEALLSFLRRTKVETTAAGDAMKTAGGNAAGLKSNLSALSALKVIGVTIAVTYTVEQIYELFDAVEDYKKAREGEDRASADSLKALLRLKEHSAKAGVPVDPKIYESDAATILASLNREKTLKESLEGPGFFNQLFSNPFKGDAYPFSTSRGMPARQEELRQRGRELAVPEVMREFLKKLDSLQLTPEARTDFNKLLEATFPASYKQATADLAQGLSQLAPQVTDSAKGFDQLKPPLTKAPAAINSMNVAAQNFADRVNGLTLTVPTSVPGSVDTSSSGTTGSPATGTPTAPTPGLKQTSSLGPYINRPLAPFIIETTKQTAVNVAPPPAQLPAPLIVEAPKQGAVAISLPPSRFERERPAVNPNLALFSSPNSVRPGRERIVIDPSIARSVMASAAFPRHRNIDQSTERSSGETRITKRTNVNVYAAPGMNERGLVDRMMREMERREARS